MTGFKQNGEFIFAKNWLEHAKEAIHISKLDKYGRKGVDILKEATPKDTGKTAESWSYEIKRTSDRVVLEFHNSNANEGYPIAVLIQYGHGTGTGGWVEGVDYINPSLKPLFEELANQAWKEVTQE